MREIKFRTWNKTDSRMIYFDLSNIDEIPEGGGHYHCGISTCFGDISASEIHNSSSEQKNYIFMQYTGLKDKQAKEIYEGDIVFNRNSFGCISSWGDAEDTIPDKKLVIFDDDYAEFKLAYIPENIRDRGYSGYGFCKQCENQFEIIGNIYENPELLK